MKLLALPLLLLTAAPANALTWGEFWEPFTHDHHHHYHGHVHRDYYRRPRRRMCEYVVTRRHWVDGYWLGPYNYVEGHYETRDHIRRRPC
jgi:hypothetical protein